MEISELISGVDVQNQTITHLATWLPTYVAEMNRRTGLDMPGPRQIVMGGSTIDAVRQNDLPLVVVMTPIMAGKPERFGSSYTAKWAVGIGVIVSAKDRDSTNQLAGHYVVAIRAALLQHRSLSGFAKDISWEDEGTSELDYSDSETISAGRVAVIITVDNVMNTLAGPIAPTLTPPAPNIVVNTVTTTLVKEELADAL